jgi:hypothetical protein
MLEQIGLIIALAIFVAGISLVFFKENMAFRIAEGLGLGAVSGHLAIQNLNNIQSDVVNPILAEGTYWNVIILILGLILFLRLFKKSEWLIRYPSGILVGIGWGILLSKIGETQVIGQVRAALLPISAETILYAFLTLTTFLYFIFYKLPAGSPYETAHKYIRSIGRYAILAMLGITFGNMVAGRLTILINALAVFFLQYLPALGL